MSLRTDSIATQEQPKIQADTEQTRQNYSDSIKGELSKALFGEPYKEDIARQMSESRAANEKEKLELQEKIADLEASIEEKKSDIDKKMNKIKTGNYSFWDKIVSTNGICGGIASVFGVGSIASGIIEESSRNLVGINKNIPMIGNFKTSWQYLTDLKNPYIKNKPYSLEKASIHFLKGLANPAILFGTAALLTGGFLISKSQNKSNLEMGNDFKLQIQGMSKEVETMQNQLKEYKTRLAKLGNIA